MMWVILVAALIFGSPGANAQDLTPLHYAAYMNASARVEVLLKAGANPNDKNNEGNTPLHYAAYMNASVTAEVLLKAGANPNDNTELVKRRCIMRR